MKQTSLWNLPGDHTSAASRGHSAGGLKPSRLILSDEHEEVERFRSYHGQVPCTLDPEPSTLDAQPSTLHPQPSTLNSQP